MIASIKRIIVIGILIAYGVSGLPGSLLSSIVDAYYQVSPTISVGDRPQTMATYNNKIYVANRDSNNISVIDGVTNAITTITVGGKPSFILAYNDKIYVANYDSGTVSIINPTTNTVISTVPVMTNPSGIIGINHKVYVWEYDGSGSPLFYIIDTIDNSVSTAPGFSEVNDIEAVNNNLYVTTFENDNVAIINTINNTSSYLPIGEYARQLTSSGNNLYVRGDSNIIVFDTVNETLNLIPLGSSGTPASDMIILGNKLYITNQSSDTLSVVDITDDSETIVNVGDLPMVFGILNNNIYVTNYNSDNISIINGTTNIVSHITVGDGPLGLSTLNNKIYVANSLSDTVSIISNIPSITYPANGGVLTTNIVTFTGVSEAGSIVSILDNVGNTLTNTIANSNNTFVANYIATGPGTYTVRPRAVFNGLANTGSFTTFSILGGQIISPANNSMTTNTSITFTGTATSGASVDILLNGLSIGTTTGLANNTFSYIPTTALGLGNYTMQPIFTLSGTTFTGATTNFSIVAPLSVPIITSFLDNTVFNTNTISFSGTVSSGASVNLLLNGVSIGTTSGTTGNTFAYTINNIGSGSYTLQPVATLNGMIQTGNLLNFSIAPSIAVPAITSFVNNAVFNNTVISLTGTATSGSTVTLLLNGTLLGNIIATSGNVFSYNFSSVANGNYTIQPVATFNWMTQTGISLNFSYIGNNGITAPVITSPLNNSSNNSSVTFYGNATPGYTVAIVNQVGNTVINGSANSNGIFSLGPISIPSGTYTVKSLTGGNNIYGNSITITTTYNNNSNSTDYCPNGDYTSSLYDGLCGTYVNNNNNNPIFPWIDNSTSYDDSDYNIDSDVLSEVCVPYEDDGYTNDLYESLKVYKKDIFVICWMKHNGLTKHTKTGYFRGSDGLRRDESTKFIYNFLTDVLNITPVKKNTFCDYKDLYKYNNDLKNYIKKSCEAGLYKGTQSNVNFNPSYFLKTNYFYSIVSNMIKVYQPNGDSDVSVLDDISEINKNNTSKMTRLKAAHALYKLSQILYSSTN